MDYGYAATVHKAQGITVDRTYVLATPHFDRHSSDVALSRHRDIACLFYPSDDFGGRRLGPTPDEVHARFTETLFRARTKELAHDYLELDTGFKKSSFSSLVVADKEKRASLDLPTIPTPSLNDLDPRPTSRRRTLSRTPTQQPTPGQGSPHTNADTPSESPTSKKPRAPELRRDGPEDDVL